MNTPNDEHGRDADDELRYSNDNGSLRFLVDIFQLFLDCAADGEFITFADATAQDQFVQFKRSHGVLYGEVGSREWAAQVRRRPLGGPARERLAALGFTHGGPERNYICDNLAQSAPYLADLYVRAYEAAYGVPAPALPNVASDIAAVRAAAGDFGHLPPGRSPMSDGRRHDALRFAPIHATAGLKIRVERALRSNFAEIGANEEDLAAVRRTVEMAGSWELLPEWAKAWIQKAEEGPLWVLIPPR